jgi:NADH:ubiquinone oxidoreductase subunit F (NADH-binding)
MQIAGYAIGSQKGYIYIRGEYDLSIRRMQKAIDQARQSNLLGKNILETGFSFDLEIKEGAGAYVWRRRRSSNPWRKRGNPASSPLPRHPRALAETHPGEQRGNPGQRAEILFHGSDWFHQVRDGKMSGHQVFTILGHVEPPGSSGGMGTPLREIVFSFGGGVKGGKRFKAALLGGAAGVFLPEALLDVRMDFESLKDNKAVLGSGAVLVMNEDASIPEMLLSILKFFAHESCGQCTPCRVGTHQLLDLADQFRQGRGRRPTWSDGQRGQSHGGHLLCPRAVPDHAGEERGGQFPRRFFEEWKSRGKDAGVKLCPGTVVFPKKYVSFNKAIKAIKEAQRYDGEGQYHHQR